MLSFEQLNEILSTISYKPHFTFELTRDILDGYTFKTTMNVMDVTHRQNGYIPITLSELFRPYHVNKNQFIDYVYSCIRKLELHETNEWFKIDGVCFNNPHP